MSILIILLHRNWKKLPNLMTLSTLKCFQVNTNALFIFSKTEVLSRTRKEGMRELIFRLEQESTDSLLFYRAINVLLAIPFTHLLSTQSIAITPLKCKWPGHRFITVQFHLLVSLLLRAGKSCTSQLKQFLTRFLEAELFPFCSV